MFAAATDTEESTCTVPPEGVSGGSSFMVYVYMFFAFPTVFWLTAYLLPQLWMAYRPVPDLKKKYDAKWALVTGAGSGIGKALAFKLASQGLNVVIVSLDDDFLKETMKGLKENFPKQEFRSVGCNFSPGVKYMDQIVEATKDIDIPIIFNNAGFIVTGFLDQAPIGKLLANIECNATAGVNISHHFVKKLVSGKKKGCIVFTSSVAGFIPTPFAGMYAATKAFVSQFARSVPHILCINACVCMCLFLKLKKCLELRLSLTWFDLIYELHSCLHIEVASLGIDVVAVHPSPVASNFYNNLDHKVDMIEAAAKSAVPPSDLPDEILRSIGGAALRDLGGTNLTYL